MKRPLLPITKTTASTLSSADSRLLEQLEARVENTIMDFCVALAEIQNHKEGIFWRERYASFAEYVRDRFGYKEQHAYRLAAAGAFVLELDAKNIPRPNNEIQARHVINKIPASHRVECWEQITQKLPSKEMTGDLIEAEVISYRKTLPKDLFKPEKPSQKAKKSPLKEIQTIRKTSHELVGKLKLATVNLPKAKEILAFISEIEQLIDKG